jgi:hypothetical protein
MRRTTAALSIFAMFAAPAHGQQPRDACDACGIVQSIQMTSERAQWTPLGSATNYAKRPNAYEKPRWDVAVKMDRGGTRTVSQSYEPLLREGDRVRVLGTQLELVNP